MNLFVLDNDLQSNVESHVDKHVVKIILEATQLACTALNGIGIKSPYRSTHVSHPITKWVAHNVSNFEWACQYGLALCQEYQYRYSKQHKCMHILDWCLSKSYAINSGLLTPHYLGMPDDCRIGDAVSSYRTYYNKYKRHMFKWTGRNTPVWIIN